MFVSFPFIIMVCIHYYHVIEAATHQSSGHNNNNNNLRRNLKPSRRPCKWKRFMYRIRIWSVQDRAMKNVKKYKQQQKRQTVFDPSVRRIWFVCLCVWSKYRLLTEYACVFVCASFGDRFIQSLYVFIVCLCGICVCLNVHFSVCVCICYVFVLCRLNTKCTLNKVLYHRFCCCFFHYTCNKP